MKKILKCCLMTLLIFALSGCSYYKTVSKKNPGKEDVNWALFSNKQFYIHTGNHVFGLADVKLNNDTLYGKVSLEWYNYGYLEENPKGGALNEKNKLILNEVHLYVLNYASTDLPFGTEVIFPLKGIEKLDTYQYDKGRSATNTVLGCLAVPVGAAVVLAVYWAFYPPSCPYLYILNGEHAELEGEIFGGAVYRPLERDDYMLLPYKEGEYKMKVSNELSEIQYINELEFLKVSHPAGSTVIPDRSGNLYTVTDPKVPDIAFSASGKDLKDLLTDKDSKTFLFNETPAMTGDTSAFNSMILSCSPPAGTDSVKLIIKGGNQAWADFQVDQFTRLFGDRYGDWIKSQNKSDGSEALKWQHEQQLFIEVYIETETGWKYADYFELTGPMGRRDLIMQLPVVKNNQNQMRVKLSTGFMFWELDYAAFDWSENQQVNVTCIDAVSAITEKGKDVSKDISAKDKAYYVQYVPGEEVYLNYLVPAAPSGMANTLVLHSRGYYEHVRDYAFGPDMEPLLRMKEKGRLSKVSFENYNQFSINH